MVGDEYATNMKKALVVGINHYDHLTDLCGCVNDARAVNDVLGRHGDGKVNFDVKLMVCVDKTDLINRAELRDTIRDLFATDCETALFYFAGHGHIESTGGYLIASDSQTGDDGVSLQDILLYATESKARNRVIILDSCHSGITGTPAGQQTAALAEGITILTASTADQYASENNGSGVFTNLLVDALSGAAANLVGEITPGSVYAHIDQSLGSWDQRPIFKTNVKSFVSLRTVQPPIPTSELRRIIEFFPSSNYEFRLDPSYEPDSPSPSPSHTLIFAILQKYNRVNLLVPIDTDHMYYAAIESKSCKLTVLGEHYRRLVELGRI